MFLSRTYIRKSEFKNKLLCLYILPEFIYLLTITITFDRSYNNFQSNNLWLTYYNLNTVLAQYEMVQSILYSSYHKFNKLLFFYLIPIYFNIYFYLFLSK